jgi:fructokinase
MGKEEMGVLYGGIEAGGTKFVCAVGTGPDDLRDMITFPTTADANETIGKAIEFLQEHHRQSPLTAIGIGSFGPVDLSSGKITSTPKRGWVNTEFAKRVHEVLGLPIGFDTDVNAAALGEYRWGVAKGLDSFVYLTVGTGIGGGGMVNGQLMHGLLHPEMGHIRIPHHWNADPFPGVCPYHGNCLEGLASGPALECRWGVPPQSLPEEHQSWDLEAHYLALALANFVCTLSPQRIIIGGGVTRPEQPETLLIPIRYKVQDILSGYVQVPDILEKIDTYIVPPHLGDRAGVLGAIALAQGPSHKDNPKNIVWILPE